VCEASDALRVAGALDVVDRADWRSVARHRRSPRRTDAAHRVVLLGTAGGANPKSTRTGYANAVVVDDAAYLVDCGEGSHRQLWRAGLTVNASYDRVRPVVRAVFVTHLHADHIMDLANLFLGSWPGHVVDVYGPSPAGLPIASFPPDADRPLRFPGDPTPGLRATMDHLLQAFAYNINVRIADEGRASVTEAVRVHEIGVRRPGYVPDIDLGCTGDGSSKTAAAPAMEPVVIYPEDDHGVTVSAVLVQHAPVFPALGFRFDTPHGSVAFSGDTGACENVVRLARRADVLVHEAIDVDRLMARLIELPNYDSLRNHLASSHTAPQDAGAIAAAAGVRTLALSHLVPGDLEKTEEEWEAAARAHFGGDLLCGVDLDELPLLP
jgi:ribonuclease BN (tRNA processing enzyme)